MEEYGVRSRAAGRNRLQQAYNTDLPRRQVLSVCEHFSFNPLITMDCLNVRPNGEEPHVYFDRYFARYITSDPFDMSLHDESYDLIICDQCYHRFDNPAHLADQIYRLLKPGGFCYLSGKTRMAPPRQRMAQGGGHLYLIDLRRHFRNFWVHNYVPLIIENPVVFERTSLVKGGWRTLLPVGLRRRIYSRLTEFVWVLTKKK